MAPLALLMYPHPASVGETRSADNQIVPQRNRALDGLRGIAALTVLVAHAFQGTAFQDSLPEVLQPGRVGVRLFFVLSGALITGVLCHAKIEADRVNASYRSAWLRFAARRALRILPLAYLTMLLMWLVGAPAMGPDIRWWYLTFTANVGVIHQPNWPQDLSHFWTLQIEEQIYLVWPLLVFLMPWRWWPVWAIVTVLVSATLRFYAGLYDWDHANLTDLPFFYLDAFAIGGLVGYRQATGQSLPITPLALVGLAGLCAGPRLETTAQETGMICVLAAAVACAWRWPALPVLSWRPLAWIGTISYGIYVWHLAGPTLLGRLGYAWPAHRLAVLLYLAANGIGLAALTWYLFERPILAWKEKIPPLRPRVPSARSADPATPQTRGVLD